MRSGRHRGTEEGEKIRGRENTGRRTLRERNHGSTQDRVDLERVPERICREEWQGDRDDVQIDAVAFVERGALTGENAQAGSDGRAEGGRLQDVAVLRAALVVGLEHQGGGADDAEGDRGAREIPEIVQFAEEVLSGM
jgi:hypothetical protein